MLIKEIRSWTLLAFVFFLFAVGTESQKGILYPRDSESRTTKLLDGIWNFRAEPKDSSGIGLSQQWYNQPLVETGAVEHMPVPSSYQEMSQERDLRDFIGWVWYDREFWVPSDWNSLNRRIFLRFGSVNFHAVVWINGEEITEHRGGHLPFQAELTGSGLNFGQPNRITVAVNNTLTGETVPQGFLTYKIGEQYPPNHFIMTDNFDFFKYAGIHRSVFLYTTPQAYIDDITVTTIVAGTIGSVSYTVDIVPANAADATVAVELIDKEGKVVTTGSNAAGILTVPNANLWWPYTMNPASPGYLYTLKVTLTHGTETDVYRLKVGIRSVKWSDTSFLINDQPFYFMGYGRHEDVMLRGRGFDPVLLVKDHKLIQWTGANSYRTTHYPYSEELMDLVDELGIVIIDECSAVSLTIFGSGLLEFHKNEMTQLIQRDKNHPSVVIWSVANEPRSEDANAEEYFRQVFAHTRSLDTTRPVGIVLYTNYARDKAAQFADIVCLNRYHAWYSDVGEMVVVNQAVKAEAYHWMTTYKKPFIYTEYGSDTIAGLHASPSLMFTEEWQTDYMREYFKAFDEMRANTTVTFIGEMIWNFADFMTKSEVQRVVGNKKGVFTRDRQPKASAHLLRSRYHILANNLYDYTIPSDLHQSSPVYPFGKAKTTGSCSA